MCCKKIKQILFPLNIFGKDKRSFEIDVPNPPYTDVLFNIEWTGERLDVRYAALEKIGNKPTASRPVRYQYTNGTITEETITVHQEAVLNRRRWTDKIYIECTNVTYLSVNGEDLI